MLSKPTFVATIYCGLRVGRTAAPNPQFHSQAEALAVCQDYCDRVGFCVTVTPTTFVYKGGFEDGVAVGLINYPRFPKTPQELQTHALTLADELRAKLGQWRVSVVLPDRTYLLGDVESDYVPAAATGGDGEDTLPAAVAGDRVVNQ